MSASVLKLGSSSGGGSLLRVTAFTSSGTWTKQADVGSVLVQVVGGGGSGSSSGGAGGTSSFGSHCSATGGAKAPGVNTVSVTGGVGSGGVGSGGDINLRGGNGGFSTGGSSYFGGGSGGAAPSNTGGGGGTGWTSAPTNATYGGGAGGFSQKLIQAADLSATETVTIGAGGTTAPTGGSGIVIVYEYGI